MDNKAIGLDSASIIQEYVDEAAAVDTWVPEGYCNFADMEKQYDENNWAGAFKSMASSTYSNPDHYLKLEPSSTDKAAAAFSQASPKIKINIDTPTDEELDLMTDSLDTSGTYSSVRADTPWGKNIGFMSAEWSAGGERHYKSVSVRIFNPSNYDMLLDYQWEKDEGTTEWKLTRSDGSLTGITASRAWKDRWGGSDDDVTWTQRIYIPGSYYGKGYDWSDGEPSEIQKWVDEHVRVQYSRLPASGMTDTVNSLDASVTFLKSSLKSQIVNMSTFQIGAQYPNVNFVFDSGVTSMSAAKIPTGEENKKSLATLFSADTSYATDVVRNLLMPLLFEQQMYYDYDYWRRVGWSLPMIVLNIGTGQSTPPAYRVPCTFVQYRLTEDGTVWPFQQRSDKWPIATLAVFRYEFTDKIGGFKYIFERKSTDAVDYGNSYYAFFHNNSDAHALEIGKETYAWKEAL